MSQNKNATEKGTKSTNPSKSKSQSKKDKELTEKNKAVIVSQVKKGGEKKYSYPEGIQTSKEKKVFRRNARNIVKKFNAELDKLRASEVKADIKEYKRIFLEKENWIAENYLPEVAKAVLGK